MSVQTIKSTLYNIRIFDVSALSAISQIIDSLDFGIKVDTFKVVGTPISRREKIDAQGLLMTLEFA